MLPVEKVSLKWRYLENSVVQLEQLKYADMDGTLKSYRSQRQQYFEMQSEGSNIKMDKQTILQNILTNYSQYGITEETIIPLIDSGIEQGLSYDLIYLGLKMELCKLAGEEFYCTSDDMARAFGVSDEEMNRIIEESRQELAESGENPDEYFREVKGTRFMI